MLRVETSAVTHVVDDAALQEPLGERGFHIEALFFEEPGIDHFRRRNRLDRPVGRGNCRAGQRERKGYALRIVDVFMHELLEERTSSLARDGTNAERPIPVHGIGEIVGASRRFPWREALCRVQNVLFFVACPLRNS